MIGGAEELVADGCHREALPWTIIMHTLCREVRTNDAPEEVLNRFASDYEVLRTALGVPTCDALAERQERLRPLMPEP